MFRGPTCLTLGLAAALALAACGDKADDTAASNTDSGSGAAEDPATVPLDGACPMETDQGGFIVQSGGSGTGIDGAVANGVVPQSVLEELQAEGDCRLLRRNNPFCDPACEPGETCDWDGECIPYPSNQDLGTVTFKGLGGSITLEPVFPGYTYFDTSLSTPPWTSGELVTLEMPGGTYGPQTLHGVGVDPLVVIDEMWEVEAGRDLTVSWEPPTAAVVRSEVGMVISVDQHGTTPGTLYCTFEDTGTGTVPAAIVDGLIDSGVTGFPSGQLERRTIDRADLSDGGCMDLRLSAPQAMEVDVIGYTPCVSDADCPEGLDCNEELQICE